MPVLESQLKTTFPAYNRTLGQKYAVIDAHREPKEGELYVWKDCAVSVAQRLGMMRINVRKLYEILYQISCRL